MSYPVSKQTCHSIIKPSTHVEGLLSDNNVRLSVCRQITHVRLYKNYRTYRKHVMRFALNLHSWQKIFLLWSANGHLAVPL